MMGRRGNGGRGGTLLSFGCKIMDTFSMSISLLSAEGGGAIIIIFGCKIMDPVSYPFHYFPQGGRGGHYYYYFPWIHFHCPSIRIKAENNGSIIHFESTIFSMMGRRGNGGGGPFSFGCKIMDPFSMSISLFSAGEGGTIIIVFFGSMVYFPSTVLGFLESKIMGPFSKHGTSFSRAIGLLKRSSGSRAERVVRWGGCAIICIFFGSMFDFLSIRVSIAENNGSIFISSPLSSRVGIIFFGSMFHFPSIGFV